MDKVKALKTCRECTKNTPGDPTCDGDCPHFDNEETKVTSGYAKTVTEPTSKPEPTTTIPTELGKELLKEARLDKLPDMGPPGRDGPPEPMTTIPTAELEGIRDDAEAMEADVKDLESRLELQKRNMDAMKKVEEKFRDEIEKYQQRIKTMTYEGAIDPNNLGVAFEVGQVMIVRGLVCMISKIMGRGRIVLKIQKGTVTK